MSLSERVMLLVHLLRRVHRLEKNITSKELKKITDKMPLDSKQKTWLDDIYRVKYEEERLFREEIRTFDLSTLARVD